MSKPHRIAVIPGDGIGTEVVPEGLRVLDAAGSAFDLNLTYEHFDYASADYYTRHGKMLPDGWFEELNQFDSIFFGAVGWPDVVPDHVRHELGHQDEYRAVRRRGGRPDRTYVVKQRVRVVDRPDDVRVQAVAQKCALGKV